MLFKLEFKAIFLGTTHSQIFPMYISKTHVENICLHPLVNLSFGMDLFQLRTSEG
jgi:hypothetical protein